MKRLIFLLVCLIPIFAGCSKGSMNPIQSAGCAVESVVLPAIANSVASTLHCSAPDQIQASLQTALGNVNMCQAPLPAPVDPSPAAMMAAKDAPKWSKIGDISQGDIDGAKAGMQSKALVHAKGIVGSIACPIVVNTVIGFATSQIPSAWKCDGSADAAAVATALSAACVAAVPL